MEQKNIIIIGAGFAGLKLARKLNNKAGVSVTLFDKYNFHQFQPLFYQVATARIEPTNISFPLRKVFQNSKNVRIRLAEVTKIVKDENKVETTIGDFEYDYLVVCTGCTTNFFGNKNIEQNAFPMKSTIEAVTLQNRLLTNFEDALTANPEELEEILNIVIVGGGPTGVELAGAIAEMKKYILPKDYPDMDFSKLSVYLLEGGDNLLAPMSDASHKKSRQYLEEMGVNVWTGARVLDYDGHTVFLEGDKKIPSKNLIWAAGVTGNLIEGIDVSLIQRGNRIKVDRFNRIEGTENILAIGDIAYMETPKYPNGHPQVANVAINQATNVANNIIQLSKGNESIKEFEYSDPGSMATVGKKRAVVDLPKFSFQGKLAWFTWMFLHLMLILSVRNKVYTFFNWASSYLSNDTTLRIILKPSQKDCEIRAEKERLMENK